MPARVSAMTLSLNGAPIVGLAVEGPPMECLGQDGGYLGEDDMLKQLGFASVGCDGETALAAGVDWSVVFSASTGRTDIHMADGTLFFSGTIALLAAGEEGARWLAAATSQGVVPVITGPGVSVDEATGMPTLGFDGALWLFAPVTVS